MVSLLAVISANTSPDIPNRLSRELISGVATETPVCVFCLEIGCGVEPCWLRTVHMPAQVFYDDRELARDEALRCNAPVQWGWIRRLSAREIYEMSCSVVPQNDLSLQARESQWVTTFDSE